MFGSASSRLVLGTCGRRKVAVESQHSLLVFGPTQSGKTTGLAVPAILEWPGPVVTTSIKGDLIDSTIGWRSRLGNVWVFDPAAATRYRPAGWSPLATCETWEAASRTAWDLSQAGKAAVGGGMNLADFWFSSSAKALGPYLYAAAASGRTIADVTRWVEREEKGEVTGILRHLDQDAVTAHEATHRREDRARSALFQVMQEILAAYRDPTVAKSAETHDIDTATLLDGKPNTLYVASPHHDQSRLRPLFAALLGQVITAVHKHAAATNAPLAAPLLVVLDEAANIAPVDDLPTLASTGAALGLQLVTVFQDLAQIRDRYGTTAGTIVNNHRAKLMLPGVSDVDTLDLFSRLAGEEEIDRDSITKDQAGPRSATTSTQWRRLLPPELARTLQAGKGVLLYGNLPPIQLRLRPWYRSRALRGRAGVARLDQQTARPRPAHTEPEAASTATAAAPGALTRTGEPAAPSGDVALPAGGEHPRPPERADGAALGLPPNATALDAARARLRHSRPTPRTPGGDD